MGLRRSERKAGLGDARYLELLTGPLTAASRRGDLDLAARGLKPPALARLLLQAGHGASYGATTVAQHRAQLAALVAAIVR